MIQKVKILGFLSVLFLAAYACNSGGNKNELALLPTGNHKVEILEVIQASSYTYLKVDEDGEEYWMAVNKQVLSEGDVIYHLSGLEMPNFESKDLGRTFDKVYFVQDISSEPIYAEQQMVNGQTEPIKPKLQKMEVTVEKPEGGVSIGELYLGMAGYKDKTVIVRGEVVKVNLGIMDRNWIHIQDGTGDENHFDLTITTQHSPKVGDVVTYWGKVSLNRDFGMGYSYDLILEEAEAVEQK